MRQQLLAIRLVATPSHGVRRPVNHANDNSDLQKIGRHRMIDIPRCK
jgi:hypothetical protein